MMTKTELVMDYLMVHQDREKLLLSNVLESFDKHKQQTLKDLGVLKDNLKVII